jgi:hypothetical protein
LDAKEGASELAADLLAATLTALFELTMASNFHIQKPYVLATLPSPLQRPETPGRCTVGVVFGQRPGPKKRTRRSELAIGIDGDAVNLYDVRQIFSLTYINCQLTMLSRYRHRASSPPIRSLLSTSSHAHHAPFGGRPTTTRLAGIHTPLRRKRRPRNDG